LNVTPAPGPADFSPAGYVGHAGHARHPGQAAGARRYVHMWASSADLERSIEVLKTSFAEGRLTKDELDQRLGEAFTSRFFAELMALTADLPVGLFGRLPAHPATRPPPMARRPAVVVAYVVLLAAAIAALLAA
jgi:Domain of unknown function (DUF1707)